MKKKAQTSAPLEKDKADEERAHPHYEAHAMAAEIASELEDELGDIGLDLAVKALPAVPTVLEVKALLKAAMAEPRDYLFLRLLYYTGVRVGELASLCFVDVFNDGTLFIRRGKGDYDRYVCIDSHSVELIRQRQGRQASTEPVIGLQPRQMNRVMREYGKHIGLVKKYEDMERSFSPHSLRHGFATHRYDAGMDLAVLQKLLGHRYLTTTMIYVQTSMRHAAKEYRKTDPLHEE